MVRSFVALEPGRSSLFLRRIQRPSFVFDWLTIVVTIRREDKGLDGCL